MKYREDITEFLDGLTVSELEEALKQYGFIIEYAEMHVRDKTKREPLEWNYSKKSRD